LVAMLALSSFYLYLAPTSFIAALLWAFILIGIAIRLIDRPHWNLESQPLTFTTMVLRLLYSVLLAVTPALFHGATGAAVIAAGRAEIHPPPESAIAAAVIGVGTEHLPTSPTLWDPVFLAMDNSLLGWIFPRGQVGLWAQSSSLLNPSMPLGRLTTEVLQCTYMTYYLWGNGMLLFLTLMSFKKRGEPATGTLARFVQSVLDWVPYDNGSSWMAWRKTRMLLYGWIMAYCLNFAMNFATPAVSPRLWLQAEYNTPLEGLFLGQIFQNAIKSAAGGDAFKPKSFGAFPSGHVGLTWLAAIAAGHLGLHKYSKLATVGACLMTCAVVYLRYHYFVDALFASTLVYTGLVVGRMTPALRQADERNLGPMKATVAADLQPLTSNELLDDF